MSTRSDPGLVEAVLIDLRELHVTWMSLAFPRQREGRHSVLGAWRPESLPGRAAYTLWSAVGVLALVLVYPLALLGFATRFHVRRIDSAAASLGIVGVVLVSLLVWGALSAATYASQIDFQGFVAVVVAGLVATVSAALAVVFSKIGGRFTTVVLAYPFGMTALFLPPVVAALYSPTVAALVLPRSDSIAIWLLDNVLAYGGLAEYLRARFELAGLAYVGMWFAIAVPLGWFFGILVTLANVVRPTGDAERASKT